MDITLITATNMTKQRALEKAKKYIEWAEKKEQKSTLIDQQFNNHPGAKDWNYWTQPIQGNARGQAFANNRERLRNKIRQSGELLIVAKKFREKADNLTRFANTHKGDAEKKRQEKRNKITQFLVVGNSVQTIYGTSTVMKINAKTVRIQTSRGWQTLIDKSFLI